MIKRTACFGAAVVLMAASLSFGASNGTHKKIFTGEISDGMCGLTHKMMSDAKKCTLGCVKNGAQFVLADPAHHKVYDLSDQGKARPFAGEKVKVEGTLKGHTIEVSSISPAQ